jgi:betaine-homocysteine S-methyltransferase
MTSPLDPSDGRRGLRERLAAGPVICAEGDLFELERRGYLQAGAFVPEVVLEHPDRVQALHEEFVHAGSDVVQAFTYYAHREKLRVIGKDHLLESMNRQALQIARNVAVDTGTLLAGDVCNTNVFNPADPHHGDPGAGHVHRAGRLGRRSRCRLRRRGDVPLPGRGADRAGCDPLGRAAGSDHAQPARLPTDPGGHRAGRGHATAGRRGSRGRRSQLRVGPGHDAAVAAGAGGCCAGPRRRTPRAVPADARHPNFQALADPGYAAFPTGRPFPTGLDPFTCTRYEIGDFTRAAHAAGVQYLGLCCGAAPHHVRAMAEALGRTPPASRYSEDMSRHVYFGSEPTLARHNLEYGRTL